MATRFWVRRDSYSGELHFVNVIVDNREIESVNNEGSDDDEFDIHDVADVFEEAPIFAEEITAALEAASTKFELLKLNQKGKSEFMCYYSCRIWFSVASI